jgi:hypothetical protein
VFDNIILAIKACRLNTGLILEFTIYVKLEGKRLSSIKWEFELK